MEEQIKNEQSKDIGNIVWKTQKEHNTKQKTQKTKRMNNMDPTKNSGVNPCAREG